METIQHRQILVIKDILLVNVKRGRLNYTENVLAVGIMRQANFPDQKALTARGETNSEPNQPGWAGSSTEVTYCSAWAARAQSEHQAENMPFSLHLPLTHVLATPRPATALVKHVEGSSVRVQSCYLPMQSCHMDDPDLVFFLRATCHTSSWGDHDHTLPGCFLTRPHAGQTLTVAFLTGPNRFPWSTRESPWQGQRDRASPLLDLCGSMRECAGSKASSLQNHWAHFSVVLGLTGPILVHWFFSPQYVGF